MRCLKVNGFALLITILLSACTISTKKNEKEKTAVNTNDTVLVKLEPVSNIAKLPVEINEPVAGGNLYVTDVSGKVWTLTKDSMLPKPFFDKYGNLYKLSETEAVGRVYSAAFHPRFSSNHKLYVSYVAPSPGNKKEGRLVISQFTVDPANSEKIDIKSEKKILQVEEPGVTHNGGKMAFGPDGYLYISIGDDSAGDSTYIYGAQNLSSLKGKILRIDVDQMPYKIPADNPFINTKNARPEIWAYGFRKFWRYSFDPVSHKLVGGDVGENIDEEIDIVTKGGNYGWPVKEGDSTFQKNVDLAGKQFVKPIYTYTHLKGICVVGGGFYYGKDFPGLTDKYIFADWQKGLFALSKSENGKWNCTPVKIVNQLSKPLFICGCFIDSSNQLFVVGYLAGKSDIDGVIYKVVKA